MQAKRSNEFFFGLLTKNLGMGTWVNRLVLFVFCFLVFVCDSVLFFVAFRMYIRNDSLFSNFESYFPWLFQFYYVWLVVVLSWTLIIKLDGDKVK